MNRTRTRTRTLSLWTTEALTRAAFDHLHVNACLYFAPQLASASVDLAGALISHLGEVEGEKLVVAVGEVAMKSSAKAVQDGALAFLAFCPWRQISPTMQFQVGCYMAAWLAAWLA